MIVNGKLVESSSKLVDKFKAIRLKSAKVGSKIPADYEGVKFQI